MSCPQRKSRDTTTRTYSKPIKQRDAEQYSIGSSEVDVPEPKPKYHSWDIRSRTSYKTQPTYRTQHTSEAPVSHSTTKHLPHDYPEEEIDADIPPVPPLREPEPRPYGGYRSDYDRYSRRSRSTTRGNVHPTFVKRLPTEYKVEVRPWTAVRPTLYEPFYDVDLRVYQSEDSYGDLEMPAYPNGHSRYSGTRKPQYLRFKFATTNSTFVLSQEMVLY